MKSYFQFLSRNKLYAAIEAFLSVISRTLKVAMTNPIEYTKAE